METASCLVMAPASFSAITSLCTCAVHAALVTSGCSSSGARGWAWLRHGNALSACIARSLSRGLNLAGNPSMGCGLPSKPSGPGTPGHTARWQLGRGEEACDHLIQLGIVAQLLAAECHVPCQLVGVPGQGPWRLQDLSLHLRGTARLPGHIRCLACWLRALQAVHMTCTGQCRSDRPP